MTEFRKCPFCGNDRVKVICGYAECLRCHCQMHPDDWNTRPEEDRLRGAIITMYSALTESGYEITPELRDIGMDALRGDK